MPETSIDRPIAREPSLRRLSAGAVLLAVTLPLTFLHERWQRLETVGTMEINASDVAIVLLWVACCASAAREGLGRVRALLPLGVATTAFAVWVAVSIAVEGRRDEGYGLGSPTTTAVTFFGYAVFAVAPALLVRTAADRRLVVGVIGAWGILATAVGVVQFLGVDIFGAWPPGRRQPSFLGTHDLAALTALMIGLAVARFVGRDRSRTLTAVLAATGVVGLALSGAVAGIAGLLLGLPLALVAIRRSGRRLDRRTALAATCLVVVSGLGVLSLRGGDIVDFASFVGRDGQAQTTDVESYSQRTVLAYLGLRMFMDHPVTGVGWMRSNDPAAHASYLDDARARFDVAEEGLPTAEHPYGIQNAYVQALADMGVPGALVFLGWLASCLLVCWRAAGKQELQTGVAGLIAVGVAAGLWAAEGIVAGVPLEAATWLAPGIVAAAIAGNGARARVGARGA